MTRPTRILITGFKPFPGAPYNPTEKLVARLMQLRRPALSEVERIAHIFPVTYRSVDRQLPELIGTHMPDAILMFGLAGRTNHLRIETRARNTVTQIWPDAEHASARHRTIVDHADSTARFGADTDQLLQAARQTGIDARTSINAGYYLCNYLSWRAIEQTRIASGPSLAAFIHVPKMPRDPTSIRKGTKTRITFEALVDAGEALLMSMVKFAKQRRFNALI